MCGIFGAVGFSRDGIAPCLGMIAHRGPDDFGEYFDDAASVYLGHRRLSIIDLSPLGKGPMRLRDTEIIITFNGEIYNYLELKEKHFSGERFASGTDTEVVLKTYQKYGKDVSSYLRGMFAFGIYDASRRLLYLTRDRVGIKPLYYYEKDQALAFSSELSAIKAVEGFDGEIDPVGLDYYFTYGYIPAPYTAYKHVRKLPPGHFLEYDVDSRRITNIACYWRLKDHISTNPSLTENEWVEAVEAKLRESIRMHLMSDVPLGAFLSGGLDSSLVVAFMSGMLDRPVNSFTIGFDYDSHDEREFAEAVAKRYGTNHTVEVVKPDALSILPALVRSFGEPFSDASAIPTYYVSQIARKHVTVALSGDGGDEAFGGYSRYARMDRLTYLKGVPVGVRRLVQHFAKSLPRSIPGYGFLQRQGYDGIDLYTEMHTCMSADDRSLLYTPEFQRAVERNQRDLFNRIVDEQAWSDRALVSLLQVIDLHSYLPDDILAKVDRMSMLHSLETRVPFLDHEVLELAFSCPPSVRFKNKTLKYVTKRILENKLPPKVLNHKKHGFGVPIGIWFRNDLKEYLQDHIEASKDDPYIDWSHVQKLFSLHQHGGRDFSRLLYSSLMYRLWYNEEGAVVGNLPHVEA
jgi:asparagine synthase (glutamine-hydrolysing)